MDIVIKIILDNWFNTVSQTTKLLDSLSDEQLMKDVAPGRNSGIYLLGHLTAVHDHMLPLLGFEEREYPGFLELFIKNPDKSGQQMPSLSDLRAAWASTNAKLEKHFRSLQPTDWLMKHTSVSAEDFAKEPHRNRLNVVLSRTTHLSNHLGQLLLLK
jgi:hypothetical protein